MLKLISLFFLILASSAHAQDESIQLSKCFKKVKYHYNRFGPPSDRTKELNQVKVLKAGEMLKGFQNQNLAQYEQDVLVYMGSGSYYSGYFQDYVVADPQDCLVLEIVNIYSE